MRITPTHEQMAYLASIGVAVGLIPPTKPIPSAALTQANNNTTRGRPQALGWTFLVVALAAIALIAAICVARGEESAGFPQVQHVPQSRPTTQVRSAGLASLSSIGRTTEAPRAHRPEGGDLGDQVPALTGQPGKATDVPTSSAKEFEAPLRGGDKARAAFERHLPQALGSQRVGSTVGQDEIRILSEQIRTEAKHLTQTMDLLVGVCAVLAVLAVTQWVRVDRRLKQIAAAGFGQASPVPHACNCEATGRKIGNAGKGQATPICAPAPPPAPSDLAGLSLQQEQCLVLTEPDVGDRNTWSASSQAFDPWTLGLSTAKGNVRPENQDCGLSFRTAGGHGVLVVADGCGGVPHGKAAACLACASAAESVKRSYRVGRRLRTPRAQDAAARAVRAAGRRLAAEGDRLNIRESLGGLRTTLIVVIEDGKEIGYAYIGDGGGCVVRATGEIQPFLTPQKADGLMNVLAASLGPTIEGEPVTGTLSRMPGDLVLVGSDGVFDRVGPDFPKDVLRGCITYEGDLQAAADHIVDEMASFKDPSGYYPCDDNLTLGLLGDGTPPRLPPGYWLEAPPEDGSEVDSGSAVGREQEEIG